MVPKYRSLFNTLFIEFLSSYRKRSTKLITIVDDIITLRLTDPYIAELLRVLTLQITLSVLRPLYPTLA